VKKFSLLAVFVMFSTVSYAQTITIAQIQNNPDQILGSMLLKEIYKRANIPLKFIIMPGKRALIESSNGRVDGETHRIYSVAEKYQTLIRVPTPLTYFEPTAFSKKSKPSVSGWSSLSDYGIIGMVRGMQYAKIGLSGVENIRIVTDSIQLMKMLDTGRIDIAVTTKFNGLYHISELNLPSIIALTPAIERHNVYHYLHKKHIKLIPKINAIIKSLKDSGELELLRSKFINKILLE